MRVVTDILTSLQQSAPIEWDRYTDFEGGMQIYGWIKRSDGQRDFVVLDLRFENGIIEKYYITSSAKYTLAIGQALGYDAKEHNACKKVSDLFTKPVIIKEVAL